MARIFAYGSSTTYGYHDTEAGGYTERLKTTMFQRRLAGLRPRADVYNFGMLGRTLPDIVNQFEPDLERYAYGRSIGMFMLGIGDSKRPGGREACDVSERQFRKGLEQLGQLCVKHSVAPLYIGVPPIDERYTKPFAPSGEIYTNEDRLRYDALVRQHAHDRGERYVAIWDALGGDQAEARGVITEYEGLHLNARGHQIVHDVVLPELLGVLSATEQ